MTVLLGWFNKWRSKPQPQTHKHLTCASCHERIRKGDRFKVLSAKHNDCRDTRKDALPKALDEFLGESL